MQHQRDPNKSYLEQLQDFSKTPVGAAGIKGKSSTDGALALTTLTQVSQLSPARAMVARSTPATKPTMLLTPTMCLRWNS